MSLPEQQDRMVYFAVSDYVFNTASLVYHESGYLNFSITDDMVRIMTEKHAQMTGWPILSSFLSTPFISMI